MSDYLDNLDLFDEEAASRGQAIFSAGGVKIVAQNEGEVEAEVAAEPPAKVTLKFTPLGEMVTCKCSCGEFFCPHMAAVIHCLSSQQDARKEEGQKPAEIEGEGKLQETLSALREFLSKRNFAKASQTNDEFISFLWPLSSEGKIAAMRRYFAAVGDVFFYEADLSRLLPYVSDAASKSKLAEDELAQAYAGALEEGGEDYAKFATPLFIRDPSHSFAFQKGLAAAATKIGFYKPLPDSAIYNGPSDVLLLPELASVCLDHVPFAFPYAFLVEQLERFAQRKEAIRALGYLRLTLAQEPYWVAPEPLARYFAASEVRSEAKEIFRAALTKGRDISSYVNFRLFLSDGEFLQEREQIFASLSSLPYYEGCVFFEGPQLAGEEYGKIDLRRLSLAEIYRGLPRAQEDAIDEIKEIVAGKVDAALALSNPHDDNGVIYLIKDLAELRSERLPLLSEDPRLQEWEAKEPSVRALLLLSAKKLRYLDVYGVREYGEGR